MTDDASSRERARDLDSRVRRGESDAALRGELTELLDQLERKENGLRFRYVPAGEFDMGSTDGDADESPVHRVTLDEYWITDAPLSWQDFCRLMDWELPPAGLPRESPRDRHAQFLLHQAHKIRLQYCEDQTLHASDWHAHDPRGQWRSNRGVETSQELFGYPDRKAPESAYTYAAKPMVSVSWQQASELATRLTTAGAPVALPTEAQWERGARGLRSGELYPWGAVFQDGRCDCNAFEEFRILPSRHHAPNDYGLYAMSGGVWEWCRDHYDGKFYERSPARNPCCVLDASEVEYVLRGGSWADCPEACTVSFRMSQPSSEEHRAPLSPNVGFRLVLSVVG